MAPEKSNALVELFEYWAEQARQGNVLYGGVAAALTRDQIAYQQVGYRGFEENCRKAVYQLDLALDAVLTKRRLGPRNFDLAGNFVEYPLVCPISWDFLTWLVDAEMNRQRFGAPPPLRVAFTKADEIDPNRISFFENVCRPLLPLIGAVETPAAEGGRFRPFFTMVHIAVAAKGGAPVPKLKAPDEARRTMAAWLHGSKPVVITLREVGYFPHRNSNLAAWLAFANDLKLAGKDVLFVRDTAKANEPLLGFPTCPVASYDVQLRMALYEQAEINLCVANGPGELLYFSNVPYLYFVNLKEGDTTTPESWTMNQGISVGEQWPWAMPDQRMVWKTDDYDNLKEAWNGTASTGI